MFPTAQLQFFFSLTVLEWLENFMKLEEDKKRFFQVSTPGVGITVRSKALMCNLIAMITLSFRFKAIYLMEG